MEILRLKKVVDKYIDLNKRIVDFQSIVIVPSKKAIGMPVDEIDIEEDFIYFCFAKFTKTIIAIDNLIEYKLYEDALILLRSCYESFINAKSVVFAPETLEHFVEYKLGLIDNKKYKKRKFGKIQNIDTEEEVVYIDKIYDIAKKAKEEISYKYLYKYLCEITHCNFITSGYYRDGVVYSYKKENMIALYNLLLWSIYINYKFYNCLIEDEIFDIEELEDEVLDVLNDDILIIVEEFESMIKNIEESSSKNKESYITMLKELKNNILDFVDEE